MVSMYVITHHYSIQSVLAPPWTFKYFVPCTPPSQDPTTGCCKIVGTEDASLISRIPIRAGFGSGSTIPYDLTNNVWQTWIKLPYADKLSNLPAGVNIGWNKNVQQPFIDRFTCVFNNLKPQLKIETNYKYYDISDSIKTTTLFNEDLKKFMTEPKPNCILSAGHLIYNLELIAKINNVYDLSGMCSLLKFEFKESIPNYYIVQMGIEGTIDAIGTSHELGYGSMMALQKLSGVYPRGGSSSNNVPQGYCTRNSTNITDISILPLSFRNPGLQPKGIKYI